MALVAVQQFPVVPQAPERQADSSDAATGVKLTTTMTGVGGRARHANEGQQCSRRWSLQSIQRKAGSFEINFVQRGLISQMPV